MAQSLTLIGLPVRLFFLVSAVAMAMLSAAATAQNLPDPTRPPILQAASASTAQADSGPVLQSILIAPNRRIAIINGQAVALHGKYGNQVLIKLTETEAVLRNGKELQTLKIHPDFEKKIYRPAK
jgi:MSHA biogenesis protein MshK